MRIGVTGAFGFLGANFVSALLRGEGGPSLENLEIVAFASKTRANPILDESKVEIRELDVLDPEALARELSGLDALAHFAGRVDYRLCARLPVWETGAIGAKRVFEAALAVGLPRLLYVSSVCVLGSSPPGALASEAGSPYADPRWPISFTSAEEALAAVEAYLAGGRRVLKRKSVAYIDAKLAAWELAKAYVRDRALPIVTVFPGTVVGAGDLHQAMSRLVDQVWEGRLRLSLPGSTSFVSSRDFARGAILALERGKVGEGYVIGGREEDIMSYADFQDLVALVARKTGWRSASKAIVPPRSLLLGLATVAERLAPGTEFSAAFVRSGSLRNVCGSAKARSELGYDPSTSLEEAILECRAFSETLRSRQHSSGATG